MKKYLLLFITLLMTACSDNPVIHINEDPVLHKKHVVISNIKLISFSQYDVSGSLKMKSPILDMKDKVNKIKGQLSIFEYNKNEHARNQSETLSIVIDGKHYDLEIINSIKVADELGKSVIYKNYYTARDLSFELSSEILEKILASKRAQFELAITDEKAKLTIELLINQSHSSYIKQFMDKIVNTTPTN